MIIGIAGPSGAGKNTAADYLQKELGYNVDAIKEAADAVLVNDGSLEHLYQELRRIIKTL